MTPKTIEERKLWKQGYRFVACIDEVGRGPLAGPVVAAAVVILPRPGLGRIRDSKKLSPKRREEIYAKVINYPGIQWGIGIVSEKVIDKINILEATKLAMEKAIDSLNLQYSGLPHGGSKATARNDGRTTVAMTDLQKSSVLRAKKRALCLLNLNQSVFKERVNIAYLLNTCQVCLKITKKMALLSHFKSNPPPSLPLNEREEIELTVPLLR